LVIAFKTRPTNSAITSAKEQGVKIATYDVIYQLIDDVVAAIEGLLEPEIVETKTGKANVLEMFRTTKAHKIVGAKLTTGFIEKGEKVFIYKDKTKVGEAIVESLQKGPENMAKVETAGEYGIGLDTTSLIEAGNKLIFIKTEEKLRKLRG
jgi:translation initiation factor IF-2